MTAENVAESTITQANGDITINNNGFSPEQVVSIIKMLTDPDTKSLAFDASKTADDRIVEANNKLIPTIEKENPDLFNRFREPAIQMSLRAVYNEYVKTDDIELGDGLIDMFIERLKVDERTTEQCLIDEAIQILPKLTNEQLDFIALFIFDGLAHTPKDMDSFKMFYEKLSPLPTSLKNIKKLKKEIDYLKQLNLFTSTPGYSFQKQRYDSYRKNYKCLMTNGMDIESFISKLNTIPNAVNYHLAYQIPYKNGKFTIAALNDKILDDIIIRNNLQAHRDLLFEMFNTNLMSDVEIKSFFSAINPNWSVYFDMFENNKDIQEQIPSLLAKFIGLKRLGSLLGEKLSLDILYAD